VGAVSAGARQPAHVEGMAGPTLRDLDAEGPSGIEAAAGAVDLAASAQEDREARA
jgi:hypothetical protein